MRTILLFENFCEEQSSLLESSNFFPTWKEGGILLIRGIPLKDGLTRLYAARVTRVFTDGLRGFMKAYFSHQLYVVLKNSKGGFVEGKFPSDLPALKRVTGLNSYAVGLNSKTGKTPLWRESIQETNFDKFFSKYQFEIESIPGIYFPRNW